LKDFARRKLDKVKFCNIFRENFMRGEKVFAVVKTGGKQYVVKPGDRLIVEKLEGNPGDIVELKEVLLVNKEGEVKIGTPYVESAVVTAEIIEQKRGPKIIVFKKKPKKGYKRKKGHRQYITVIEIKEIRA